MKRRNVFSALFLLIFLLASCNVNQFGKGAVSIRLDGELLSNVFPNARANFRAAEDELYSAKLTVSGDFTAEDEKFFSRTDGTEDVFFKLENLTPGIKINLKLDLCYEGTALYSGTVEGFVVNEGDNPVELKLKATGEYNPFRQATVIFKSEETVVKELIVKKGDILALVDMPDEPEKEGYEFKGWYDENDQKIVSGVAIENDITLSAKFEKIVEPEPIPVKYTVIFVDDGAVTKIEVDENYELQETNFPKPAEKDGYEFKGWYFIDKDGKEVSVEKGYKITGNLITISAKYEKIVVAPEPTPVKYTVIFVNDDAIKTKEVDENYELQETDFPKPAEKEGYEFKGWYFIDKDGNEFSVEKGYKITGNLITIKAKYEKTGSVELDPVPTPKIELKLFVKGDELANNDDFAIADLGDAKVKIKCTNCIAFAFMLELKCDGNEVLKSSSPIFGNDEEKEISLTSLRKLSGTEFSFAAKKTYELTAKPIVRKISENKYEFGVPVTLTFTLRDENDSSGIVTPAVPNFDINWEYSGTDECYTFTVPENFSSDDYEITWKVNDKELTYVKSNRLRIFENGSVESSDKKVDLYLETSDGKKNVAVCEIKNIKTSEKKSSFVEFGKNLVINE